MIGAIRKVEGLGWLIVVNLIFTGVGWLAAMIMAFAPRRESLVTYRPVDYYPRVPGLHW